MRAAPLVAEQCRRLHCSFMLRAHLDGMLFNGNLHWKQPAVAGGQQAALVQKLRTALAKRERQLHDAAVYLAPEDDLGEASESAEELATWVSSP